MWGFAKIRKNVRAALRGNKVSYKDVMHGLLGLLAVLLFQVLHHTLIFPIIFLDDEKVAHN